MIARTMAAAASMLLVTAAQAEPPAKLSPSELQWREMFPGVQFAPAYGDWEKEAHAKYVRFAPGTQVPMHTHAGAYEGVMISGRMVNLHEGGKRVEIAPGDFWHIGGGEPHGHECLSKAPCFFYTHSNGLWDLQLVEMN